MLSLTQKLEDKGFIVKPKNQTSRLEWIDIARGIAVFMVVLGHIWYSSSTTWLNTLIYAVHVPLFLVLSGFLFKTKKDQGFLKFFLNKVITLLLPTFLFVGIGIIIARTRYNITDPLELTKSFFMWDGKFSYNAPCWYFLALFQISLIGYFIDLPNRSMISKPLLAFVFFVIAYVMVSQKEIILAAKPKSGYFIPMAFDRTMLCCGFFIIGSLIKDLYFFFKEKLSTKWKISLSVLLFVVSFTLWILFAIVWNKKTSIYGMNLGNYWSFIFGGIFGSIAFLYIAFAISKIPVLGFIIKLWGQNSMFIMGTHYIAKIGLVAKYGILITPFKGLWQFDVITPFFVFGALLLYLIPCLFINRYIPWVVGKKEYFYTGLKNKINNGEKLFAIVNLVKALAIVMCIITFAFMFTKQITVSYMSKKVEVFSDVVFDSIFFGTTKTKGSELPFYGYLFSLFAAVIIIEGIALFSKHNISKRLFDIVPLFLVISTAIILNFQVEMFNFRNPTANYLSVSLTSTAKTAIILSYISIGLVAISGVLDFFPFATKGITINSQKSE